MALYYDLPVFKEVYKLILVLFEVTKDFPKEYKYTVGQNIKAGRLREIGRNTYLKLFHRACLPQAGLLGLFLWYFHCISF
jgi:hypothetical protein